MMKSWIELREPPTEKSNFLEEQFSDSLIFSYQPLLLKAGKKLCPRIFQDLNPETRKNRRTVKFWPLKFSTSGNLIIFNVANYFTKYIPSVCGLKKEYLLTLD